jgi:glycosyltransferase involved in cell wall biosynthesis
MSRCIQSSLCFQRSNFRAQTLVFTQFDLQEFCRQLGSCGDASWRKHIGIGEFVFAIFEVLRLKKTLSKQHFQAVVDFTQAHTELAGQLALIELGLLSQQLQSAQIGFLGGYVHALNRCYHKHYRKIKFMLRVLCFGRFFDAVPGGMQTHVDHLFRAMKGHVEFVHLVPSRDTTGYKGQVQGFPLIRTPSWNVDGSLCLSPQLISTARQLHLEKPFDLVHLHFPDPMSHLASWALPASVPRVITWHADIIRQKLMLLGYRPFQNAALNNAKGIIAATPAHIKSSRELIAPHLQDKLHVIPFGFDLAQYSKPQELSAKLRQSYPGNIIFALGRHVHYKGFDVLIKAMAQLPQDTQLVIGGEGPLSEEWKALAALNPATARIHFVGMISDADLPAYFQACDVFCLPAVNQAEAFGIVQVEAFACAKPVVSTKLNNGVDFVNQDGITGYTVTPSSVNELAQALSKLLADPILRQQLGAQALQRASQEFSLDALRSKTLAVYEQAVR